MIYRLLLLLLLPLIGGWVAYEGQHYDRGLIDFQAGPEGPPLPQEVAGLVLKGPKQVFDKENLYQWVNGHAEYFLSMGFKSLTVADYFPSEGSPEPWATLEAYQMSSPLAAFGVLADEAGPTAAKAQVGQLGFRTGKTYLFIQGSVYFKVLVYEAPQKALELARAVASQQPKGDLGVFAVFPELPGLIETRFAKEAYRGMEFAQAVLEREYEQGEYWYQLAYFTKKQALNNYLAYLEKRGRKVENQEIGQVVEDPYEGRFWLFQAPEGLFVLYGDYPPELPQELAQTITQSAP